MTMVKAVLGVAVVVAVLFAGAVVAGEANPGVAPVVQAIDAHAGLSAKAKDFAKQVLVPLCTNPVLVKAVQAQNAAGLTLATIKERDKAWKEAEDELPIHAELTSNPCAEELKRILAKNAAIVEAFVTDNQGANVGQNALTSDYWQGDEAKWKNSYNNGQGGVDVGEVEFDKSANAQLQQVSLPILDAQGKAIGAVTCGLALGRL